ncbi:MAG TPA: YHYH domain-containing protein [Paenirhodobacter sp.]
MKIKVIVAVLALTASSLSAAAHSGGTDASGCHTNHKTGVYHCH